jgi:integrase
MFKRKTYNKARDKDKHRRNMDWITGRPNTITAKTSLFTNWVKPHLLPDGSNLAKAVQKWEQELEPNSVKSILYVAKAWVKHETGNDLDIKAHIKRVGRSKQQLPTRTLNRKEIAALVKACKAPLLLPVQMALQTGMRRGEVWGLKWEDIDLFKGVITVTKSYEGPTKSGRSRIIPISTQLEQVLVADPNFLTYNSTGKRRLENVVKTIFDPNPLLKEACKKAGIRGDITFHTLRHTFATLALESGASPKLVSQVLGHASLATTLSIYWGVTGEALNMDFLDE